jgi:polysaccharide biosynthesis PFTS motif protein
MIFNFLKKKKRAHIRSYMRGYNILKIQNKINLTTQLKDNLVSTPINNKKFEDLFINSREICAHQFLAYRLLNYEFNKEIQIAFTKNTLELKYSLPKTWRTKLEQEGFNTNTLENKLLWIGFKVKWYLIGVASVLFEISRIFRPTIFKLKEFVYFENLKNNNLPEEDSLIQNKTIINWYIDQKESKQISTILHSVKSRKPFVLKNKNIYATDSPIPPIKSIISFYKFFLWALVYSIESLFSIQKSILFREEVLNKVFSLSLKEKTAKAYFFHNSGHLLRPLWTYEAEKRGAEIIFYFYSTNISSFETKDSELLQVNQWQLVSWPIYWVWNTNQKQFLERYNKTLAKIKICGPIPFSSSTTKQKIQVKKPSLLVFDVQPTKNYYYESLGLGLEYYTRNNSIKFLNDIDEISFLLKINVLFKRKRSSLYTDKNYIRHLEILKSNGRWIELDPDLSAITACETKNIIGSISTPFTSTAIIADKFGLASIYYDSTNSLNKKQTGANGLRILGSKKELLIWINNLK